MYIDIPTISQEVTVLRNMLRKYAERQQIRTEAYSLRSNERSLRSRSAYLHVYATLPEEYIYIYMQI